MSYVKRRRLLILDPTAQQYQLRAVQVSATHDPREDYGLLSGEALCQYLIREAPSALVIARGPLPYLPGNKSTVGYISPLTGLPHYSFVGGRGFAELFNLGLDAIVLSRQLSEPITSDSPAQSPGTAQYIVISGHAPQLHIAWKSATHLPTGQRSAYYWLLAHELDNNPESGSVFTLGEAARHGYRSANVACDGLYHAGRGGAGYILAQFTAALVLRGEARSLDTTLHTRADAVRELRNGEIRQRLAEDCDRFSRRDGGTVTKLYRTGSGDDPTLPARNAQRLGYDLAEIGARKILNATRAGQTGCHWCQVNCRHWHWVNVDYAPGRRDMYLDDFEPTYALFAMLDLQPEDNSRKAKLRLLEDVDRHIVVPIEEMGIDVIDLGVGLAALFEGLEKGKIPPEDVPPALREGPYFNNLARITHAVQALRKGTSFPALRATGDGPQALAARYPDIQALTFTSGRGTLGNPGHSNALWTFLMPFSRFFSHYSGQIYKVPGDLSSNLSAAETQQLFANVIAEMLHREYFGILGNALSMCAFTFVIFSEAGQGVNLDSSDLLVRTLATYGIEIQREDLIWFAETFWAQSIMLKIKHGWELPASDDFPTRVFEALSHHLPYTTHALQELMDQLIAEWKRQAEAVLQKYGYSVPWTKETSIHKT